MSRYAIIDLETTGLSPAHHHRILEAAVVLVDDDGEVVFAWGTLVNPERDIAASEIHGLTGVDVYDAPTFSQIAGYLAALLRGRVPVAHNLTFDTSFLIAEYSRLGVSAPLTGGDGLCTMRLASHYLRAPGRTLKACCDCIGYSLETAHSALSDAHATAALLAHFMRTDGDFMRAWFKAISASQSLRWPDLPVSEFIALPRSQSAPHHSEHFLGRLASRTPRSTTHSEADSYLELLDRILLDRQLSRHELEELVASAQLMGISREEALRLHRVYLHGLAEIALEDGVLTPDEVADLRLVAAALGLDESDVDAALKERNAFSSTSGRVGRFVLQKGDRVVFTGQEPGIDRVALANEAQALGLRVTGAVSCRTQLLVAADPDSMSGKARKARELRVPIVNYRTYLSLIGELRSST